MGCKEGGLLGNGLRLFRALFEKCGLFSLASSQNVPFEKQHICDKCCRNSVVC